MDDLARGRLRSLHLINAPTISIRLPQATGLLQAGRQAAASGQGAVRARVVRARVAWHLGPPFLHADGNLLGQAVFTLKWLQ
jgi:hypothetical protein